MKINREDVVQAALIVERWCAEHYDDVEGCDCPFFAPRPFLDSCRLSGDIPCEGRLEYFLRTRGLSDAN